MNRQTSSHLVSLDEYQQLSEALFVQLKSGDTRSAWRFKWTLPAWRDTPVADLRDAPLHLSDAQVVIVREHGFDDWRALREFVEAAQNDGPVARFESAVEAVVRGDLAALQSALRDYPELAHTRSTRRHHAMLLHYIAANGVEAVRQKTPPNALEITRALLDAGAYVDALAGMYESQCTTLSMLVSSCHPANAGLQTGLAELLVDHGASIVDPGPPHQSAVVTALAFGYAATAQALARRAGPSDDLALAAGLGRLTDVIRLLPAADSQRKHIALALASQHGHAEVVSALLDAGEDPNRFNPKGFHAHSTPLHQAAWNGHMNVVRLLVERGARLDIRDTNFHSTPLGWATHGGRTEVADYLRASGAQ